MAIALCTLVLNESEWLPKLYEQHRDWPGLCRWVFVEAADRAYAKANPEMVSPDGLSTDGTTEMLQELARQDDRIAYVPHGWTGSPGEPAQGKCEARSRCLQTLESVRPDFFITLDADEFYTSDHQAQVERWLRSSAKFGAIFRRREIWRPPSIAGQPLFSLEVTGGFWDIPCCHWWRWRPGLCYRGNHNTPEARGEPLTRKFARFDRMAEAPQMIHLGFAASKQTRLAKNRYYAQRGEDVDPRRAWYVQSRAAFETWRPGVPMPHGARVRRYDGPVPECFRESV